MQDIEIIHKMKEVTVLVVGDIMLDRFIYGAAERISPEGPIPVLKISREAEMLGGAGNVLANLSGLKAGCKMISVIGDDDNGRKIRGIIRDLGYDDHGLVVDDRRPTTVKSRFIAQNQQLLRTDSEDTQEISKNIVQSLEEKIDDVIGNVQALVISDYNKGVLAPEFIQSIFHKAKAHNVPVLVDPKRDDFAIYKGADFITPNKKELSEATSKMAVRSDEDVEAAAKALMTKAGIDTVIATRSEDGISVLQKGQDAFHIKTKVREVYDVSGAGDTVIAVLAASLGAGADVRAAAKLANKAGGIVVGKTGTASIQADELEHDNNHPAQAPALGWEAAKKQIAQWQEQGLKVGFTNGCFDIIHYGHVNYLNEAKARCDKLVLGLNSDASVKILKGPERPINDEKARASVMGALGSIDLVVLFGAEKEGEDNTPCGVIDTLRPDIIFKGGDYTVDQLPEAKIAMAYGGEIDIMPLYDGYSTTSIIEKSKTGQAA